MPVHARLQCNTPPRKANLSSQGTLQGRFMYSKPWPGRGGHSCCVETGKPWSILEPSTSAPADYCFLLHHSLHHAPACIDFSQPSGSPDRLLSRLRTPHAGLGGREKSTWRRIDSIVRWRQFLKRAARSWKAGRTPGADAYNSKHRTSMVCSPCLELYPDEHEIQSDSWDRIAYFR